MLAAFFNYSALKGTLQIIVVDTGQPGGQHSGLVLIQQQWLHQIISINDVYCIGSYLSTKQQPPPPSAQDRISQR
jgi:hypothetical protein